MMDSTPVHILKSKLRPPRLDKTVARPRLLNRLLENSDKRITIIRADAGYGKTTLAAQYVEALDTRSAWYRLDESDRAVNVFLGHLSAAVDILLERQPASLSGQPMTFSSRGCAADEVVAGLLRRLDEELASPAALVLDDYHVADPRAEMHSVVETLLRHLPESLRLLILSRGTPALALGRLRVRGDMLSLSTADLELSREETLAILEARGLGEVARHDALERIHQAVCGWAAGLVLLADWLMSGNRLDDDWETAFGSQLELYEYLAQEAFARQPREVRAFLLDTCVLDEIGECEAVGIAGVACPDKIFDYLENEGLFFRRTQESPRCYGCHPLFSGALQRQLRSERGAGAVRNAHAVAARHYEVVGDLDRILRHAELSGDGCLVEALGARHAERLICDDRLDLAQNLIASSGKLPERAWLLALRGYALRCESDRNGARHNLLRAYALLQRESDSGLLVVVLEQLAWLSIAAGDYAAGASWCQAALKVVSGEREEAATVSGLYVVLAACRTRLGDASAGRKASRLALSTGPTQDPADQAVALSRHALLLMNWGDCLGARSFAENALEKGLRSGASPRSSWLANNLADILRELGYYADATSQVQRALALLPKSVFLRDDRLETDETLANILLGLGDVASAERTWRGCVQQMRQMDEPEGRCHCLVGLSTCHRLRQEALQAREVAKSVVRETPASDACLTTHASLAHAAALISCDELDPAATELRDLAKTTRKLGFARSEVWRRLLLAEIARRQGRLHHCDQHLRKALTLARENRYVHLMIVEGRIAPELLVRALEADIETEFACEILSRIGPWLLPQAETLLDLGDKRLALVAVRVLAGTERSWARRPLLDAVRSRDPQLSKAAAEALAGLPVQQEEKLAISALGDFRVLCGGREVHFGKRKAKHLLEYLFINRDRKLPRDVVIDTFWPESAPKAALNNFHVTLHALKRALNPHLQRREQLPYFAADDGTMQLAVLTYTSDVDEFLSSWTDAKRLCREVGAPEAIEKLRRCQELYRGDLMEDNLYEDWTCDARQELREIYFEAMQTLARLLDDTEDHQGAAHVLRKLISRDKTREELHVRLAEQYMKLGNRALAASQRKLCERSLADELGVEMSAASRRSFDKLLAGAV